MSENNKKKYYAFISYSHQDSKWGDWLHKALESYNVPKAIRGEPNRDGKVPPKLFPIFRDREELPTATDLGAVISNAIRDSAYLIVICSPRSAKSMWVNQEIINFKKLGRENRVLAIIVDGEPNGADKPGLEKSECFPEALKYVVNKQGELTSERTEPIAADARQGKDGKNNALIKLLSGLLGVNYDDLKQREKCRTRNRRIIMGIITIIATISIGTGSILYLDAKHQRKLAELEQLKAESINLAIAAQTAMDENRIDDALVYALDALPSDLKIPSRPITPEAITALKRVMSENHAHNIVLRSDQRITDLHLLPDKRLAMWLEDRQVQVVNTQTGRIEWRSENTENLKWLGRSALAASINSHETLDSQGNLQVQHKVLIRDLSTGEKLRELKSNDLKWWVGPLAPLSPSAKHVLLTRSVGAADEEKNDLGIWQISLASESLAPKLIAQLNGPELKPDEHLKANFITDTILLLSWGNKRHTLALWYLSEKEPRIFSKSVSPLACSDQTLSVTDNDKRQDKISLSKDGSIIAQVRPVKDAGWCVAVWDATNVKLLTTYIIEENKVGSVDAITKDILAIAVNGFSFNARASIWPRDKDKINISNCKSQRDTSVIPFMLKDTEWLIYPTSNFSACINENKIQSYTGPAYTTQHTLHGHQGQVRALAYDASISRLYSGGDDGQLRAWGFQHDADHHLLNKNILKIASMKNQVVLLQKNSQSKFNILRYNIADKIISSPIHYSTKTTKADKYGFTLSMMLLDNGNSIAITESSNCSFNCPDSLVKQLTLYRISDGIKLAKMDNLLSNYFLANHPISHALSRYKPRIALPKKDGSVVELDTSTGKQIQSHVIAGWSAIDVAYTSDALWILANDKKNDPYTRMMSLFRVDTNGEITSVWNKQAQSGRLHSSPSTQNILIELSLTHLNNISAYYSMLSNDGIIRELNIPPEHLNNQLQNVNYYADDHHAILLFNTGSVASLDIDIEKNIASPVGASLSVSMLDPWRIEDPLHRVIGSVDSNKLFFLNLPLQPLLCPELSGHAADAAAFNTDGKLLVLTDRQSNMLSVYDLESCSVVYTTDMRVTRNDQLHFINSNTLWVISDDNSVREIIIETDWKSIYTKAKKLRNSLGLVSALGKNN